MNCTPHCWKWVCLSLAARLTNWIWNVTNKQKTNLKGFPGAPRKAPGKPKLKNVAPLWAFRSWTRYGVIKPKPTKTSSRNQTARQRLGRQNARTRKTINVCHSLVETYTANVNLKNGYEPTLNFEKLNFIRRNGVWSCAIHSAGYACVAQTY